MKHTNKLGQVLGLAALLLAASCEKEKPAMPPSVVTKKPPVEPAAGQAQPRLKTIKLYLGAAELTVEIADDIVVELWRKFLFFAPMSGLGSITQAPIGVFRSVRQSRSLLIRAVEEVFNLARAKGVRLPPESVEQTLQFIDRLPADGTSSLQRDFQDGVRTELEALSGAVVRQATDAGVATPVHTFFYSSLLPLELKARGSIEWPESD